MYNMSVMHNISTSIHQHQSYQYRISDGTNAVNLLLVWNIYTVLLMFYDILLLIDTRTFLKMPYCHPWGLIR